MCLSDNNPRTFFSRLLSEILKETEEEVEEIEYLTDGSWRPIGDEREKDKERERSHTPVYPLVDICKCSSHASVGGRSNGGKLVNYVNAM